MMPGKQWRRWIPASNHSSSRARRLPFGKSKIPKRSSPRMIGSTAISASFRRSHSTTFGCGAGHSESVDSDSIETKNPFSGHASRDLVLLAWFRWQDDLSF